MLAGPTPEAIEAIRRHAPRGVCEVGAGEGHWLEGMMRAGIPAVGYDRVPRGPLVVQGDHYTAMRHDSLALLIVWPPDGDAIAGWLSAWGGCIAMICGEWGRFDVRDTLDGWHEAESMTLPPGDKGGSLLRVMAAS